MLVHTIENIYEYVYINTRLNANSIFSLWLATVKTIKCYIEGRYVHNELRYYNACVMCGVCSTLQILRNKACVHIWRNGNKSYLFLLKIKFILCEIACFFRYSPGSFLLHQRSFANIRPYTHFRSLIHIRIYIYIALALYLYKIYTHSKIYVHYYMYDLESSQYCSCCWCCW